MNIKSTICPLVFCLQTRAVSGHYPRHAHFTWHLTSAWRTAPILMARISLSGLTQSVVYHKLGISVSNLTVSRCARYQMSLHITNWVTAMFPISRPTNIATCQSSSLTIPGSSSFVSSSLSTYSHSVWVSVTVKQYLGLCFVRNLKFHDSCVRTLLLLTSRL